MERREHSRLDIELRCQLWRRGDRGDPVEVRTRNISRGGMLIEWVCGNGNGSLPLPDEDLDIDVVLPASQGYGPRCIHCQGKVIRVAPQAAHGTLIALRVLKMNFRHLVSAIGGASRGKALAKMSGVEV